MIVIDFTEKFSALEAEMKGNLKKLAIEASLSVYYGINQSGGLRLCFRSSKEVPQIESTKLIRVSRAKEAEQVHWLNFDLVDLQAKTAFYALCGSLIVAVQDKKISTEDAALTALKNHFYIWRKLMRKDNGNLSEEMSKGLFGELYFLLNKLAPKLGINDAVEAWSGPDGFTKDFAFGDTWYEIKTIAASAVTIKISSLSQLSSSTDGHLVIYKVDTLGERFEEENTSVNGLVNAAISQIISDETRELFLDKLIKYGYSVGAFENKRYQVVSGYSYRVNENFPRLLQIDIKHNEIAKVTYELIVNSLEKYKEEFF